jgi:hypothetical protein
MKDCVHFAACKPKPCDAANALAFSKVILAAILLAIVVKFKI